MRFISRNRYRKIGVGILFALFLVLIISHSQQSLNSVKNIITRQTSMIAGKGNDKDLEWTPEKLKQFMHLLDKQNHNIYNNSYHSFSTNTNNNNNNNFRQLIQSTANSSHSEYKLQFPSLSQYLTYISDEQSALTPSFVLSKRSPLNKASLVFGVPHIKRSKESYLQLTLYFLIKNIKPWDLNDTHIIVFIAETDMNYVMNTTRMIVHHFEEYINSGILAVISPSPTYYPDFNKLYKKQTLGDPLKRVHWRTKQNLDFAYLMMYAYTKGDYYVQLEDDVVSTPDYVGLIKEAIIDLNKNKTEWFTIRFCRLGFIGQMLKSQDLPQLITFMLIFHEDQPSDWLLDYLIQTRVCRKDKDAKDCRQRKDSLWRTHKTSLFQHIGYHSSLDGKVQKLKDKFFKTKTFSYIVHKDNPPADVITSLKSFKDHTISKSYKGDDYFWAINPKDGDHIIITFNEPTVLDELTINSGNFEHPNDKIPDETTVEIIPQISQNSSFVVTSDGYYIIGSFVDGFIKITNLKDFGLINKLRV
ncbi:alpha-1,3-mannosyl-glycoprotein 4-beta-N-acetylglucosaminyltransferase A-like [Oppia nitens]|uniref:alpha-1,3-mannosyl-glycoprotein 4-beta-N-acetylglucosaminyltransferase A-like n=1 Tax=Oppia nitens TaxID=1686743 RepID=UPI0023DA6168|nr:alpha-1,3-mannosyl-glycoprotein 4-beta-N-acetylglucosaminyltransferase A-like [Oppia nitens]